MKEENKFVHQLMKSIEHYARAHGVGPAPTWKLHGSPALSSLPDILGVYHHTTFFMECKIRERPKRKFDLMVGVKPSQKATLRVITAAGGHAFLAVRLGKDVAIVMNFKRLWNAEKIFPSQLMVSPVETGVGYLALNPYIHLDFIRRKPGGLWVGIDKVLHVE
jgi:hypothetical protein